jgi:dTDP-4-amino-4,6-dideoxygalactose transaminase
VIEFNSPSIVGRELAYIREAVALGNLSGEGDFGRRCEDLLRSILGNKGVVLLTPSCTAALEMCALLLDISERDEVLVPSYTFVTTASAFALRGAKLVFCDVDPLYLNITYEEIVSKTTSRTKAVVLVHYAGWPCEIDKIVGYCTERGITVVGDAAHALGSQYGEIPVPSCTPLSTLSFHETKNITCGEGGALVVNDPQFLDRAYVLRDKGTNRRAFQRGDAAFYTWVDLGSSFVMSDVLAAFLFGQLEHFDEITNHRRELHKRYVRGLHGLRAAGHISFPDYPSSSTSSAHLFFVLLESSDKRRELQEYLKSRGIHAVFHYQPLHLSPFAVSRWGESPRLPVSEDIAPRLLRLPLYHAIMPSHVSVVCRAINDFYGEECPGDSDE